MTALACVLTALVLPVAGADEHDDHPLLRQARENVEAVEARLAEAGRDRDAARRALAGVEEELATVEQRVNEAVDAVRVQLLEVEAAGTRLAELRDEAEALEDGLADRAVRLHMAGTGSQLEVILEAGDVQAAIDRSSLLDLLTMTDRVELERVVTARTALAAQRERFDRETARLERMRDQEQQLLDAVQELRDTRASALRAAQQDVDDLSAQQDQLAGEADRIAELIAAARSTPVAASTPSGSGYIWPVCSRINSYFGYRWGRQHAGIDLDGDTGDPIGAAKAGVVIAAGRDGGYGNLVLIDHGDGIVTAYAHQSELLVVPGQRVDRGERIGSLGNTGNSTGPHLHFETRVNGSAVDPLRYLPNGC